MTDVRQFKQDPDNANLGTDRGQHLLVESIEESGFGRSLVVDAEDTLISGNKSQLAAIKAGITEAIVVESEGDKVVVHRRKDLHGDDVRRSRLALADNRVGEVNLLWDMGRVAIFQQRGVDLSSLWDAGQVPLTPPPTNTYPDVQDDPELYEDEDGNITTTPPNGRRSLTRDEKTYHITFNLEYDDSIFVQRALTEWEKAYPDNKSAFLVQLAEIYLGGLSNAT